jgi:hypothetical protein
MINYMSYRHYSPASLGGLQATEEGTCIAIKFEAMHNRVQRASASPSVKLMLRPDLSNPSAVSSSGKCDTATTNVEQAPNEPH